MVPHTEERAALIAEFPHSPHLLITWPCHGFSPIHTHILTVWATGDTRGSACVNTWLALCYSPTRQLATYPWTHGFCKNLEPAISEYGAFLVSHPPLVSSPPLCISRVAVFKSDKSNLTLYPFLNLSYFLVYWAFSIFQQVLNGILYSFSVLPRNLRL